jgi:hypothetical protein
MHSFFRKESYIPEVLTFFLFASLIYQQYSLLSKNQRFSEAPSEVQSEIVLNLLFDWAKYVILGWIGVRVLYTRAPKMPELLLNVGMELNENIVNPVLEKIVKKIISSETDAELSRTNYFSNNSFAKSA